MRKKFIAKAMFWKTELRRRAKKLLTGNDGNVLTENGLVIALAFMLVMGLATWAYSYVNKDFLPNLGNGIKNIFNFKG